MVSSFPNIYIYIYIVAFNLASYKHAVETICQDELGINTHVKVRKSGPTGEK